MVEPYAIDVPLHLDARGWLMATDGAFEGLDVAYVYATHVFPGVVKAWHRHRLHADRLLCVEGVARIVAARVVSGEPDMGPGSLVTSYYDVREFVAGPLSPKLVVVPPGWWHGFSGPCTIVNAPSLPYDPEDEERLDWDAIPFDWGCVNV